MTTLLPAKLVRWNTWSHLPVLCALLCIAPGCRETPTMISGDVRIDGTPLRVGPNIRGTVVFQPTSHKGPVLNGMIGSTGHFQLAAGSSRSIEPGVYLATVTAVEIEPAEDANSLPSGKRITPAKYASSNTSGLRVEVKPGANQVTLDLKSDHPDTIVDALISKPGATASPVKAEPGSSSDASTSTADQE